MNNVYFTVVQLHTMAYLVRALLMENCHLTGGTPILRMSEEAHPNIAVVLLV
jgi:hypothetical protein